MITTENDKPVATEANNPSELMERYQQRRQLATFYQEQITALNVAPVQAWSAIPLFLSVAALAISVSGPLPFVDTAWIVLTALVLSLGLAVVSKVKHGREAETIQTRYLEEHALLFPDIRPVPLVGFLLEGRRRS